MTASDYDVPLVDLYRARGLVGREDPPRGEHLPTRCSRARACWAGLDARFIPPEGSAASELSPPWIGPAYNVGRAVVVMENLGHYGGLDLNGDTGRGECGSSGRSRAGRSRGGHRRLRREQAVRATRRAACQADRICESNTQSPSGSGHRWAGTGTARPYTGPDTHSRG